MEEQRLNRIRELREARGWSQRRLSAEADLTISTISGIENGQRPSLETALRLAGIFGVPVEGLFVPDSSTVEVQEKAAAAATAPSSRPVVSTGDDPSGRKQAVGK